MGDAGQWLKSALGIFLTAEQFHAAIEKKVRLQLTSCTLGRKQHQGGILRHNDEVNRVDLHPLKDQGDCSLCKGCEAEERGGNHGEADGEGLTGSLACRKRRFWLRKARTAAPRAAFGAVCLGSVRRNPQQILRLLLKITL